MSSKRIQIATGVTLAVFIVLAFVQGCGDINGDYDANKAPTVEFVNVPGDAYGVDTTTHYAMPFEVNSYGVDIIILDMAGALMVESSEIVYALGGLTGTDTTFYERDVDYEMDYDATVGDKTVAILQSLQGGDMDLGETYYMDFQFTIENYYIFSYAPTVYWKGSDPDGFVEFYRYADSYDQNFINEFRNATNQEAYYRAHQHELNWVDTTAMNARIYLLTESGDTTEHIVFVKAVDDLGAESQNVEFKTFFRSNNPPNNPLIKPLELADTEFDQYFVVEDTLFCLDEITPLWSGISFNWRGDDPDDMELYQIPLEFTSYLIKTPGDTLWDKSNTEWSDNTQIQLFGLETGSYIFTVWSRDDGLTPSAEPATVEFKVVKPTFKHHILLVDETIDTGPFEVSGGPVTDFYLDLLANLEGTLENDNYVMDGVDVRLLDNSITINMANAPIPYSIIGDYKLVIIFADDHATANDVYQTNRNTVLTDYCDIGGRMWYMGRRVLNGGFVPNDGIVPGPATALPDILTSYFQIETGYASNRLGQGQVSEFIGAVPVIREVFPELVVDTSKVALIPDPQSTSNQILMEVDWFTRADEATTLYSFNSSTADTILTDPYVYEEDSRVLAGATQERCTLIPDNSGLLAVYRVENVTKGKPGTIENFTPDTIRVSYQGEPWSDTDVLSVDYKYDPISDKHLKPCAIRYESQPRIVTTIQIGGGIATIYTYTLGFRSALFGFPLYFMDNSNGEVEALCQEMLNWFFYPTIHWNI